MMKTKTLSHPLGIFILFVTMITLASAGTCFAASSKLTLPGSGMKPHQCRGFSLSLPSNWTVETFPSGMSYCAAADGKKVFKDAGGTTVSVYLGLAAGVEKTASPTEKSAADEVIRSIGADNAGLRIIHRGPAKIDGFPAESVLAESPTGRGGELERSWMLFTVKDGRMFSAMFTSPARDYGRVENAFGKIVESIRLTSWK